MPRLICVSQPNSQPHRTEYCSDRDCVLAKNCAPTAQELLRAGTMFRFTVVPKREEAPQNRKSAVEYMERALQLLRTFRLKAG